MACGGGSRKRLGSNGGSRYLRSNKWIYDLPEELGEDFPKFGVKIGFKDTQITHDVNQTKTYYHKLMEKWLSTISRHTLKHQYTIFKALKDLRRNDLLDKHFDNEEPEKHSDDKWDDFIRELEGVNVIDTHQQNADEVKESTRRTEKKTEAVHYHFHEPAMVGDNNIMSIQTRPPTLLGGLDSEKIRDQLHEIMVGQGAVGGNERRNTMNLQTLEACFHRRYSKNFKNENGIQMLEFLKQAKDYFVITLVGNKYFVHMRTPKTSFQIHETIESSVQAKIISSKRETKQCSKNTIDASPTDRPVYVQKQKEYIPCSEFEDFLKYVKNFSGDNLLLISKTNLIKHIDTLANIKWICVFDFDPSSRKEGLFLKIEDIVKKHFGPLHPRTWNEPPNITNSGTEWCFISGLKEDPESQTPDEFKKWYPKIKQKFEKHVEQISSLLDTLSIMTVVAFWPEDRVTGMKFQKIISVLEESIKPAPKVVVIGTPSAEHDTLLDMVSPDYFLKEKLEHVFHDLSTNVEPQQSSDDFRYMLPTDDGFNKAQIDSSQANSLRENMHVLYLDNTYQSSVSDMSASEEEEQHFFKGGTLNWQSYYANGPEYFYTSRDLLRTIVDDIRRKFVDRLNPGIVKILHAPGAGGTTLGQNIIWELHKITPCIQIRTDAAAKPRDIAANISALGKKTHSPIVVLSDGIEDDQLDLIQQQLHHAIVIFIHLKRTSDNKLTLMENEYILEGHLSPQEACSIGPRFIRCCRDDVKKKDQIQRLVDDVQKGVKHHLIEFGLVIHLEEFNGLASYVAEYLKIDKQSKGLNKSQRVLGYLSLVQFFGQGILPCQMLGTMLGKSDDYKLTYDKFPRDIREFTVPVGSASYQHGIRICHFLVAREILDQLLSGKQSREMGSDLSQSAKNRLQPFVLEFIDDLKTRQEKIGQMSKHVLDIIIQTFIYREFSSNQNQQRKRKFSKLIESIPAPPPFTERLKVLEKLAESFPGSPGLWAHLGRAYSLLCPVQLEKTEMFFQKAIDGCQKEESQTETDYDDPDVVLSYVLHMYGMFYLKRINAELGKCRRQQDPDMEFQKATENIINLAEIACNKFTQCRRCGVAGVRESYGCSSEINVRLCICEFLKGHYQFRSIDDLIEKSKNTLIFSFVERSVSKIQHLFMTCFNVIDQAHLDSEFHRRLTRYQTIFKGIVTPSFLDTVPILDSFETRCARIAGIKLKYGHGDRMGTVNDITDGRDLKMILAMLEQNIKEIELGKEEHSNMDADFTFRDWLYAIRHQKQDKKYPLEDVLTTVRLWNKHLNSPYSKFYLFVILFTLAINMGNQVDERLLGEAVETQKKHINSRQVRNSLSNPSKPREWLGRGADISCLQPGDTFKTNKVKRSFNDEAPMYTLAVFRGTIKPENKYREKGYISIDVERNSRVPVKIFYFPFKTEEKLVGNKYAGSRVEFLIAFTAQTVLEAYGVKLLHNSTCQECDEKVEMLSIESHVVCRCGSKIENQHRSDKSQCYHDIDL